MAQVPALRKGPDGSNSTMAVPLAFAYLANKMTKSVEWLLRKESLALKMKQTNKKKTTHKQEEMDLHPLGDCFLPNVILGSAAALLQP